MMVYGGTPPVMDRSKESQGSRRVAFVVTVGMTGAAGIVGRQSEDPAAKIYISIFLGEICRRNSPHATV